MRHRITVRADNVELRGYINTESNEELVEFSQNMAPVGVVIASAADPDYDPFAPSLELSLNTIIGLIQNNGIQDTEALVMHMAGVHYMQAQVIQGERRQKEEAQAELTRRELHHFETEQELERIQAEAKGHADSLEGNWEEGDLASAVNSAVSFLRAVGQ